MALILSLVASTNFSPTYALHEHSMYVSLIDHSYAKDNLDRNMGSFREQNGKGKMMFQSKLLCFNSAPLVPYLPFLPLRLVVHSTDLLAEERVSQQNVGDQKRTLFGCMLACIVLFA